LGNRFLVSHLTVAKWKKAESQIIAKVRKRGLFSLDDLDLSLKPYLEKLKRTNCYRTLVRYRLNKFSERDLRINMAKLNKKPFLILFVSGFRKNQKSFSEILPY